ncbi:MAG: hypothetical protein LQ352_001292 [Teloschistes flavicans]|nr:MAG: hypothetical protein LQ352_001292 [Teloschistes flavicans]
MEYSQQYIVQHGVPLMGMYPPHQFPAIPSGFDNDKYGLSAEKVQDPNLVSTHAMQKPIVPSLEEAAEAEDTSTRPRLTQEQIAVLEDNFKSKPKPGTDFKKQLAHSIGLSLQRVNNWYQNRRAKARHQRPQERRFDVLPNDPSSLWSPADMGFPEYPNGPLDHSSQFSSPVEHPPAVDYISMPRSEDMADSTNDIHTELDMFQGYLTSANPDDVSPASQLPPSRTLPETSNLAMAKLSTPQATPWGMQDWTPDSQNGSYFAEDGLTALDPSQNAFSQAMYQSSVEGYNFGNLSCQTFATASSSDSEQPSLMTPPQKTSPLPFVPRDSIDRRESVSLDLAGDFSTFHLQHSQSRSNMGYVHEPTEAPALSISHTPDGTPPAPPQLHIDSSLIHAQPSSDHIANCSNTPRLDLASRRKGPRPAALRPEVQRSVSYGPLTMSPTARVPSLGVAKQASVRRIKSTGNGLNAGNGRIQKPGLAAAPLSPRNFQSLTNNDFLLQNARATSTSSQGMTPLTPLSPMATEQREPAWLIQWAHEQDHATPTALDAEAHVTSPPITPFETRFQPSFTHAVPQTSYHWPPQSAPPQQTTFFDSPPVPLSHFNQVNWQSPSSLSMHGFHEEPVNHVLHPPMMPYLDLQPLPSQHPHVYQQMGFFQPPFLESSPMPPKEIEIQVQVIPAPEGLPQSRKTYTFNHTTPKDFSNAEGTSNKVAGTTDPNPV